MPELAQFAHLQKPKQFWETHHKGLPWNTFSGFKYHLERRHRNGLAECGAVIDSPIGQLIDPPRLLRWLRGDSQRAA